MRYTLYVMKIYLLTIAFSFLSIFAFAQYPTFKLSYKFLVDDSLLQMDPEDMTPSQKTIAETAAMALAFQDGDKPIAQVWVNKTLVRANANLFSDAYELIDKEKDLQYTIFPSSSQYYQAKRIQDDYLEHEDEAITWNSDLPVEFVEGKTKEIAGHKCKFAKIDFGEVEGETIEIHIWYTESIPQTYWGQYGYLKKIPGAALEVSTNGLGIQVFEIVPESDMKIFEIPEEYTQIDNPLNSGLFSIDDYADSLSSSMTEYELGHDRYAFYDDESGMYGVKTSDNEIIVEPQYTSIQPFQTDFAIVSNEDYLSGTIDIEGNVIIPLEFESLYFSEVDNCFTFAKSGKYGLLDNSGKIIIPNQYDHINFLKNGFAVIMIGDKYGIIDSNNKTIVNPSYEYISEHSSQNFIAVDYEKSTYSMYTIQGEKHIATYSFISLAQANDLFLVTQDNKYGYINGEGKVVIPIKYSYASLFVDGKAEVMIDGKDDIFYIDTEGNEIK